MNSKDIITLGLGLQAPWEVNDHRQSRWLERFGAAQSGIFKRFTDHPAVVKLSAIVLVACRELEFITVRVLRVGLAQQEKMRRADGNPFIEIDLITNI